MSISFGENVLRIVLTQVGSAFSVNGINVFIWELSDALIGEGHEVYVISAYKAREENVIEMFDIDNLPRIVTLSRKINPENNVEGVLLWLYKGWRVLNKIGPSMIVVNGAVPIHSSAFKVAVCHDLEFRRSLRQKWYDMLVYHTFDAIVTMSTELRRRITHELGLNPSKIALIPVCINTRKYFTPSLNQREHAMLHVGTWRDKNLETTVKAFRAMARNDNEMKLYIVGNLWDAPMKLLSKVENSLRKRIKCLGVIPKEELRYLYSRVKVTLVPSIYRIPVLSPTVLESITSGTPVIGSSTGISHDLLIHGYNGFRVYPKDFATMATRMADLVTDNKLWTEMSKNALALAQRYDASLIAKKYVQLYDSFAG